ncbi:hypothetical protein CTAYLR_009698 [Chrysophaeum taylorii]|uniref:tRNA N(3)-methylcytidine methyltransferase n=1 Tax=Chrysophaeum taylorii TaxID=2483200 RepID=A0AAD7U6W6_9STRA|nr:hypothetical protein CTAYLR_009698 [Chrysophaeum taylorii]
MAHATTWDSFYARYGGRFYKDRHWVRREVSELMPASVQASPLTWCPPLGEGVDLAEPAKDDPPTAEELSGKKVGLEVGCGCGSLAFPLLRANDDAFLLACDFSAEAISLLKARVEYGSQLRTTSRRIYAWVGDVVSDNDWDWVESLARDIGGLDFVTMVYVLSAIEPRDMRRSVRRLARLLKPAGLLFFRDYAAGDMAQGRFDARGDKNKLGQDTYARGEGTLARYFALDEVQSLFEDDGLFEHTQLTTVKREIVNRKLDITMNRIWLQAKFIKRPDPTVTSPPSSLSSSSEEEEEGAHTLGGG